MSKQTTQASQPAGSLRLADKRRRPGGSVTAALHRFYICFLAVFLLMGGWSGAALAQNLIANPGFENNPPPNFGNNIGWPVTPWVVSPGPVLNVVKVDGGATFNYGILGPNLDADPATGVGVQQHYLDIAGGSNTIYQSFVVPGCGGGTGQTRTATFSGWFSTRDNLAGSAFIAIRLGTGTGGTELARVTANLPAQNSSTAPWTFVSGTVNVTTGSTISYVVDLSETLNFDQASLTLSNISCLRLQKALPSGRAVAGDQFILSIGGSSVTTTGTGNAVTSAPVTVNPATIGASHTFQEVAAAGANLAFYTTTYSCTNARSGGQTPSGSGTNFNITPVAGDDLFCTFTNTLNTAPVALTKVWVDSVTGDSVSLAISGPLVINAVNGSSTAPFTTTNATAQATVGSTVNLAETFAGNATGYTTTVTCVRNTPQQQTITVTNNSFTMIGPGVNCTFTNTGKRGSIVITKDAVPNDAQDFAFTTTGTGLSAFNLDDDGDGTLPNSRTFTNLLSGTYAVTEGTLPAGWTLTDLNCTDPNGGTSTNISSATANIQLSEGETVTCTYVNTRALSDLSITKTNNVTTLTAGTSTTYTVVATNNGPDAVTGATVRDPAQAGLTCNDPVPCTGSGCPAPTVPLSSLQTSGVVLGTVANGDTVTFTLTCTVP